MLVKVIKTELSTCFLQNQSMSGCTKFVLVRFIQMRLFCMSHVFQQP